MSPDGDVKSTQIINQTFGTYIKGPMALDENGAGGHYSVYLAIGAVYGNLPPLRFDVATGAQTEIALPDGLIATSLVFDAARGGVWVLAGNATKILEDGYYLAFVARGATAPASVRALGRAACSALTDPEDNWSATATMTGPDTLVAAITCQLSATSVTHRLLSIDVTTGKVTNGPATYPVALPGVPNATAQPFGIAFA